MKPVLLATDGSPTAERATETAIELAQVLETELVVVTVWDIPYTTVGFAPVPVSAELARLSEEDAVKASQRAVTQAEQAGVHARRVVLRGLPIQEICLAAEQFEPRFLVIGSHGWGAVKRAVFGSVSTGVLHHAACPVLVVRAQGSDLRAAANGARTHAHA
jgi:nucleotide-binding universal stress UspA family protein